jgi:membrane protein DedA with SNARE-associated domain
LVRAIIGVHPWLIASVTGWLFALRGPVIYVLVAAFVFGETAVFVGFVIPGESAALIGGAVAGLDHANIAVMALVVIGSAITGDSVGYLVGKHLGHYLLERRPLRGSPKVAQAEALLTRYGGPAVFLGRWVVLGRALVPGLAGMGTLRYRSFLFFNVLGAVCWGLTYVLLGYGAGASYPTVARVAGSASLIVVGLVVVGVGGWIVFHRSRQ